MTHLTMIVTVTKQSLPFVERCMQTIAQQVNHDFHLIVLQEQSTVDDEQIHSFHLSTEAHAYGKKLAYSLYQGALSNALTQVVRQVRTDYVTIVDAKDWLEPSFVEAFYASLRNPSIDLIVGNYARFLPESAEFLFHVFGEALRTTQATQRLLTQWESVNGRDEAFRRLGNTFIKTDLLKKQPFANERRSKMEEMMMKQLLEEGETVMYHHQANYMVRVLEEETVESLANVAIVTEVIAPSSETEVGDAPQTHHYTLPTLPITVLPILESLAFIQEHHTSVARFGDGEMDMMTGHAIPYQDYDAQLAESLREIYQRPSDEQFMVCQSDVFEDLERYNLAAQEFWRGHLAHYESFYQEMSTSPWYGSTFISRPYIDLVDKSQSVRYFAALRQLWEGREIVIVEGQLSRSGVGNDLFANAASVERIICPSRNAFRQIDAIQSAIEQVASDKLVLLMLGPTAKVLSYRLSQKGYWTIDLGHIDSEYEWFQMGATSKVKLSHKHTAEHNFDENITLTEDHDYTQQIVAQIE